MSTDSQRTKRRRNIAENFNRLSTAYERYRQTDDRRQTDGRREHRSRSRSRSLKTVAFFRIFFDTACIFVFVLVLVNVNYTLLYCERATCLCEQHQYQTCCCHSYQRSHPASLLVLQAAFARGRHSSANHCLRLLYAIKIIQIT